MRSQLDYNLWNVKFVGETRLFLEGSQVHLNGQKCIIRKKSTGFWILLEKTEAWITPNYHLAYWAAFNSDQYSVPKENKHTDVRILRCVPQLGYMLLENLHHPFSLISCLLSTNCKRTIRSCGPWEELQELKGW